MSRWPFLEFCRRFLQYKQKHEDTWIDLAENFFQEEVQRKWKRYPVFVKKVKHFFLQAPTLHEKGIERASEPSIISLLLENFFPLVKEWISLATSMTASNIILEDVRIVYEQEILYKFRYIIPTEILKHLDQDGLDLGARSGKMNGWDVIHVFFLRLFESLNSLFKIVANTDWQLVQTSNFLEIHPDGMHVAILVSFNGYKGKKLPITYFRGNLVYFLQDTMGIKIKRVLQERLLRDKNEYYDLAKEIYFGNRNDILGVIKHFHAKALMTNQISHFYELLASIISKLDLGVKNVQILLQEYADEKSIPERETLLWSYLLDLVVRQALLYETFQSNLVGLKGKDSIVFMLVLQYYLVDFRPEMLAEKIFHGEKLYEKLRNLTERESGVEIDHFQNFCMDFQHFLMIHFKLQNMEGYDAFIKGIFGRSLNRLLTRFFTSFLKTSHEQLMYNLEKLNTDLEARKKVSFEKLVDFLEDFLEFCMKHVFFQPDLDTASKQFKDPSNRFSPINIATGLFELLLYRELPFHENQWMETLALQFRTQLDIIDILDIKNELKVISPDILVNFVIHDAALKPTTTILRDFLFDEIIKPFHEFSHKVHEFFQKKHNSLSELETIVTNFFKEKVSSIGNDPSVARNLGKIVLVLMEHSLSQS